MSDNTKTSATGTAVEAPKFKERELQLLGWAMQSLKSGPPEIDNEKLANFAGMTNPRSAGNAWAALKKKLLTPTDGSVPPTPKKAGGRKTKDSVGEDGETTLKKNTRKRTNKESDDGDASPKKKGRATKARPKQEPEEENSKLTAEFDSADEPKSEGDAATAEDEDEI